jgi:hypothetical protein
MNRFFLLAFLTISACSSIPRTRTLQPSLEQPPRMSSGSLGKNIDELNNAVNNSLTRLDKIIADLGGK